LSQALRAQGEGGQIVTTASLAGMVCPPGTGPYNAAKFGNVAVAETLAAELAGTTIGVSVILSGNVQTRIADSARNRSERYGASTETSPAATEQLEAYVRLGQEPDNVAEKVMRHPGKRTICLYASRIPEHSGRAAFSEH
jgi:NAD(P)-dependent dehydrogenase (short-subunit alcohol dehydrogenase family)